MPHPLNEPESDEPAADGSGSMELRVNGRSVVLPEAPVSLLEVLRSESLTSVKDGCSPQGQCGCCTVLVDGAPRVACVTPARRVAGREVQTLEGLPARDLGRWTDAFLACGASQCGFCTPGIIMRLEGLSRRPGHGTGNEALTRAQVDRALAAHLCRCTGWQTIAEAAAVATGDPAPVGAREGDVRGSERDLDAASRRATLELGAPQRVSPEVVRGAAGFSFDTAPPGCLVAMPRPPVADSEPDPGSGEWVVGETLEEVRAAIGKVQGRRSSVGAVPPLDLPPGEWAATLRTGWVDPAYLETDASWCEPGGTPSPAAANGGAFGGKRNSPLPEVARRLAQERGRAVLAVWSREDCARRSPKRPPVAGGIRPDGTGVLRVVRTSGIADAVGRFAPGLTVEEVDAAGPPTSVALRAAGWAEAAMLLAAVGGSTAAPPARPGTGTAATAQSGTVLVEDGSVTVVAPGGGSARARIAGGAIRLEVSAGDPLDEIVLRSYCIGAAHMALSWVTSESLAVDGSGEVLDLTVRSFGVLKAAATPPIDVVMDTVGGEPRQVSPAVFAAVAAAVWIHQGCPSDLPSGRGL